MKFTRTNFEMQRFEILRVRSLGEFRSKKRRLCGSSWAVVPMKYQKTGGNEPPLGRLTEREDEFKGKTK